jgi:hypothetical protein
LIAPLDCKMEAISRALQTIRRENPTTNHYFTPSHLVRDTLKPELVRQSLLECVVEQHQVDEATQVIIEGAWNVYAILIIIKKPQYILGFIKDDHLQRSTINDKLPLDEEKLSKVFKDPITAREFYDKQWGFTAPLFSKSVFIRSLPEKFVLPFLADEELGEGSFGKVYKIQVEHSFQRFGCEPYHEVSLNTECYALNTRVDLVI